MPATISTFWCRTKPVADAGDAGEGVQERDHDRHVRAADRQHEQDAEGERAEDDQAEHPLVLVAGDDRDPEPDRTAAAAPGCRTAGPDTGSAGRRSAPAASRTRSCCPRTRSSRSSPRARSRPSRSAAADPASGAELVEVRERDQRRRAAADAVEQRHHLRHRGHLHGAGRVGPDRRRDQPSRSRSPRCSSVRAGRTWPGSPRPSRRRRSGCRLRARAGLDRKRSATMKQTIATM